VSATEIIHAIESLPLSEKAQVLRHLTGEREKSALVRGVWHGLNIRERQKRVCGDSVFPNVVLEARQLERY
jgi:hypothetical protein